MDLDRARTLLYKAVDLIPERDIQAFTLTVLNETPDAFFQVPSSSTRRYHTYENNVEGGLAVHTLKVALFGHDSAQNLCPEDTGVIVSACLLHDTRKGMKDGKEWTTYAPDHALQGYHWLEQFDLNDHYKWQIRHAVRTHMADLSYPDDEKTMALGPLSKQQIIVQCSDQAASRQWASFIPGQDIENVYGHGWVQGGRNEDSSASVNKFIDDYVLDGLERTLRSLLYMRRG